MIASAVLSQARLAFSRTACRSLSTRTVFSRLAVSRIAALTSTRLLSTTPVVLNYGSRDTRGGDSYSQRLPSSPTDTLYVGNLPYQAQMADVKDRLTEFGSLREVRLGMYPDGRMKGFAHVQFVNLQDAEKAFNAISEEPLIIMDRVCRVDYANSSSSIPPNKRLFVTGFEGDAQDLKAVLEGWTDHVTDIYFLRAQEESGRGGAVFVEFDTIDRATAALQSLNGRSTPQGTLQIKYSAPKRRTERSSDRSSPPRRGRGDRY